MPVSQRLYTFMKNTFPRSREVPLPFDDPKALEPVEGFARLEELPVDWRPGLAYQTTCDYRDPDTEEICRVYFWSPDSLENVSDHELALEVALHAHLALRPSPIFPPVLEIRLA